MKTGLDLRNNRNFASLMAVIDDPRMKKLTDTILEVGDMLFFDKYTNEYVVAKKYAVPLLFENGYSRLRYETNHDTFIGTMDGVAHFVAVDDALRHADCLFCVRDHVVAPGRHVSHAEVGERYEDHPSALRKDR